MFKLMVFALNIHTGQPIVIHDDNYIVETAQECQQQKNTSAHFIAESPDLVLVWSACVELPQATELAE